MPRSLSCVCSIAGGPDLGCEITDIQATELTITVPGVTRIGDRITLSVPSLGLVEGHLMRRSGSRHVVGLARHRALQAARVRGYLEAIAKRPHADGRKLRRHERVVPLHRLVEIEVPGGRRMVARIIDVSRSGVAVTCTAHMLAGTDAMIGATKAKVVRALAGGYALAFVETLGGPFDATVRL